VSCDLFSCPSIAAVGDSVDSNWHSLRGLRAAHTRHSLIALSSPFRWQRVAFVEFIDVYVFTRA
jgi:hypothetical protein